MLKYKHSQLKTNSYLKIMSFYKYLQLQPIDPQDDGSISAFDQYEEDEMIDLTQDEDGATLLHEWEAITNDMHSGAE